MSAPSIHHLVGFEIPDQYQDYDERDSILYALGLGMGQLVGDSSELRYVYEKNLTAIPTQLAVLAGSSDWMRDTRTGICWEQLVALSHDLRLSRPLSASGKVYSKTVVENVYDRGIGRGAIIKWKRVVYDATNGEEIGTIDGQALARGDGGFGGEPPIRREFPGIPQRQPDYISEHRTLPGQALIYRLSGDWNPLHADPEVAREAGLEAPILHGLCNLGIAAVAIGRTLVGGVGSLMAIGGRYSSIFFPGDSLRTEIWHEDSAVLFRCISCRTKHVVIEDGLASIANVHGS
ncbi:MaoC/PaaZ C-terminal domain-containing protein [Cupriavidus sp. D384]|uniref:MaoC/PaaZ C-terminal domain-containing protein n=1 Tax=Cupriavidus sp. D384 TaxID=1538095 RepID=UPI000B1CBB06|nr:MaoC/PaaZ C-terminal domain-containing protein [Cupriavidus sp. D384]